MSDCCCSSCLVKDRAKNENGSTSELEEGAEEVEDDNVNASLVPVVLSES